jgi:hypothetical protein
MTPSRPPVVATWLLQRFAPLPETDAIAGDLLEHYQHGRSRLWYWREVLVAIITGTWFEVRQHSVRLLAAITMAWVVNVLWHQFLTQREYSLVVRYVLGGVQARLDQMAWVGFFLEAPVALTMGWTVARCAPRHRIPAVLGVAGTGLLVSGWTVWMNAHAAGPEFLGYPSVWASAWQISLLTILVLLGGGLLTGLPKRSIQTQ